VVTGGLLVPPGDRISMEDLCIAWHVAVGVCSARLCLKYSGAGRALALGGRQIPPNGLSLFR